MRSAAVEEDEHVLAERGAGVDDHELVELAQQREHLLDVARRDHLRHLDPRRGEEDVDARRVAPHHLGEVLLADPIGRQVDDARRDGGDAQQAAQVAELERSVDEADAVLLPERHGDVVGERRAADATLRARTASRPASRRAPTRRRGSPRPCGPSWSGRSR